MNFSKNKDKGNTGLGIAIAYFSSHGYTVSIPFSRFINVYNTNRYNKK